MAKSPFAKLLDQLSRTFQDVLTNVVEDLAHQHINEASLFPGNNPVESKANSGRKKWKKVGTSGASRKAPKTNKVPKARKPSRTPQWTLYDELEVSHKASPETISAAFRSLSKKWHPDNYSNDVGSKSQDERYKRITAAWNVLKDAKNKLEYDKSLKR